MPARLFAAFVAASLLGGCSLGPHYRKPVAETPTAWHGQVDAQAAQWPAADWWRGFGSPRLVELIAQAQSANFDIAAAVARIRQADAQSRIAGAALLPSVGAGAGIANTLPPPQATAGGVVRPPSATTINPSINASYEIDFWGKNQASLEAAQASALASRYDRQTVELTVVTSVATTYFQILSLRDRLVVAQANIDAANSVLAALQTEENVGTATALDVAQEETTVAQLLAQVPPLSQQLQQSIDALAILLGRTPESVTVEQGTLDVLKMPPVAPGLPSELLARRPDVAEAEAQLVSANANIRVARAAYFPSINLTAEGGLASVALAGLFGPTGGFYSLAAAVTQPIFEGGALEGQVELSQARYDELVQDYRKAVVSAFVDVEDALAAEQQTRLQTQRQQEAVDKARRAYDISIAQLKAGTVNLLTVLNTENALFPAQDALVQAKLAEYQAIVSLFKALGGGWRQT
jgi:NodT family efflux transporter outer membrane factor (OMF) lipoprotein